MTEGKLLGLEIVVDALAAEKDLRLVAAIAVAVAGGDAAAQYMGELRRRAGQLERINQPPKPPETEAEKEQRKEQRKAAAQAQLQMLQRAMSYG